MSGFGLLLGLLLVLYPLLVYLGMHWLEPAVLGVGLVSVYLLRGLLRATHLWQRGLMVTLGAAFAALLWFANSELLLRLLPAGFNLALAGYFALGLFYPPTLPARMAALERGVTPDRLPAAVAAYTRAVTRVWVVFLLLNGTVAAATALLASREVWALYNGLIAYIAIGGLFAAEYAYRRLVFYKKHGL